MPVPGGPYSRMPRGTRAPEAAEALGMAQELDRLGQLELGLVAAGDVRQAHRRLPSRKGAGRSATAASAGATPGAGAGVGMIVENRLERRFSTGRRSRALYRNAMPTPARSTRKPMLMALLMGRWRSPRPVGDRGQRAGGENVAVAQRLECGRRIADRATYRDRDECPVLALRQKDLRAGLARANSHGLDFTRIDARREIKQRPALVRGRSWKIRGDCSRGVGSQPRGAAGYDRDGDQSSREPRPPVCIKPSSCPEP